jgi:hypothetical protein
MSVNVEFKSIGPGKCRWCKKDRDEVIELAFGDGSFVGRYCFADFKKALQDKLEGDEPRRPTAAPAAPAAKPEPKIAPALAAQAVPVASNGPPK